MEVVELPEAQSQVALMAPEKGAQVNGIGGDRVEFQHKLDEESEGRPALVDRGESTLPMTCDDEGAGGCRRLSEPPPRPGSELLGAVEEHRVAGADS